MDHAHNDLPTWRKVAAIVLLAGLAAALVAVTSKSPRISEIDALVAQANDIRDTLASAGGQLGELDVAAPRRCDPGLAGGDRYQEVPVSFTVSGLDTETIEHVLKSQSPIRTARWEWFISTSEPQVVSTTTSCGLR
jgi:hypothetical protein